MKRRQSISASRLAGKQIWCNWKKLQALLVLVWLITKNPATDIFISFDMNKFVALFCLFVDLLAWGFVLPANSSEGSCSPWGISSSRGAGDHSALAPCVSCVSR